MINRREFWKRTGYGLAGLASTAVLPAGAADQAPSDMSQQETGLLFRISWLMEQILRTNLELSSLEIKGIANMPRTITQQAHIDVDGKKYHVEYLIKSVDLGIG